MSQSALHLYKRVMDHILAEIDAGRLQPGQQIPSERELSERFYISRMTVRHALNQLVTEGVLYRHQGRGTFVGRPKIRQRLTGLNNFTEDMLSRGMKPGGKVLSLDVVEAPYKVRQALNLAEGSQVVRLDRLRLANDEPMAYEVTYLPFPRFANLVTMNLENASLYATMEERFSVVFGTALQALEPALADAGLARTLSVREGSLLLHLERTTFTQEGEPVEFALCHFRADRYRFEVELDRR